MSFKFRLGLCWLMTVCVAGATFSLVLGGVPSETVGRLRMGGFLAFMVLLTGYNWSVLTFTATNDDVGKKVELPGSDSF